MKKLLLLITTLSIATSLSAQLINNSVKSELVLETNTGKIYGNLIVADEEKPTPVAIIIPGSGPTDRNGNHKPALNTNAYKMLAQKLAENNISSIRYDKRGIAQSKAAMKSEYSIRFNNYVSDVVEWISLLKKDKRFSKVILIGHSEGSLIGILAAQRTSVSSFISLAGSGRSIDKVLKEQLINLPLPLLVESNKIIDSLKNGKTVDKVNPSLNSIFRPSIQAYMISWLKYDPAKELARLEIPILIVQGTTDIQVKLEDAELLAKAKPDAKKVLIENMNHILKESSSNVQENVATYSKPTLPLKEEMVDTILNFIMHN